MRFTATAIVVASALPETVTWRVQLPAAMSFAAAARSLSGRLIDRAMPSGDYALIGAVLAELALAGRIDTDPQRLYVVDKTPVGDPVQDAVLQRMATATDSIAVHV